METLHFSIDIQAPADKVWQVLWNDDTYREWAGVFQAGSYADSDWKEGSKVLFLGKDKSGMVSRIRRSIPGEYMFFEHGGMMIEGKEIPPDEKSMEWIGAKEIYTLKEEQGKTSLKVDVDVTKEHVSHFNIAFPQALEKIRELSEK